MFHQDYTLQGLNSDWLFFSTLGVVQYSFHPSKMNYTFCLYDLLSQFILREILKGNLAHAGTCVYDENSNKLFFRKLRVKKGGMTLTEVLLSRKFRFMPPIGE